MATIDKKQKRWYSKSTFDSLDKSTIPVGTEIQVAGELGQADFDSDTNTKLNAVLNKLDKPSGNPTEDSLVKVSSTGSVEYVPYKKYYKHYIYISSNSEPLGIDIYAILSDSAKINTLDLLYNNRELLVGANAFIQGSNNQYNAIVSDIAYNTPTYSIDFKYYLGLTGQDITDWTLSDTVTEL